MKDIKQCSIAYVAFTLEIDAYETLYNYTESIKARYGEDPDGAEIIADIEARVAELILSTHSAERVVAKPLIDNIIAQLGSVDDICADAPTPEESTQNSTTTSTTTTAKRRLYRDEENKSIGGVCAGIAAYAGCNIALIRIVALLLLFFGGASLWVYIILWIAMPPALTARQKLEMRGEPITLSTIEEFYNSVLENNNSERGSIINGIFSFIGRLFLMILRLFAIALFIVSILAIFGLLIGCFGMIIYVDDMQAVIMGLIALFSVTVMFGIMGYLAFQFFNARKVDGKVIVITIVAWLISALTIGVVGAITKDDDSFIFNKSRIIHQNPSAKIKVNIDRESE